MPGYDSKSEGFSSPVSPSPIIEAGGRLGDQVSESGSTLARQIFIWTRKENQIVYAGIRKEMHYLINIIIYNNTRI